MTCGCYSHNGFLTRRGYALVADRGVSELHEWSDMCYLDKVGSVSALTETEITMIFDDGVLDEQHRRFLSAGRAA